MRIADTRTSRDGSSSAAMTVAGSIPSRPSRVHSACCLRLPVLRRAGQLRQRPDHRAFVALDELPLGEVAPPAIRVRQAFHQLGRAELRCRRCGVPHRGLVHHPIDPAEPCRRFQLARDDVVAEILGDVGALLNHAAIHVDDVQRAVGRVGKVDGTEPLVGRGQELAALVGLSRAAASVPSSSRTIRLTRFAAGSATNMLP